MILIFRLEPVKVVPVAPLVASINEAYVASSDRRGEKHKKNQEKQYQAAGDNKKNNKISKQ